MPKINVYLPDDLATAVREAGIPVSSVCQQALAEAVRKVAAARRAVAAIRDPTIDIDRLPQLNARVLAHMTPRLRQAATLGRDAAGAATVETAHLLIGIIDQGDNLAMRVLEALDADTGELRAAALATGAQEPPATGPDAAQAGGSDTGGSDTGGSDTGDDDLDHGPALWNGLSAGAGSRAAVASALEASIDLGHNYLGCEHLLLGLLADESTGAGRVLRAAGIDRAGARRAVATAMAGIAFSRDTRPSSDAVGSAAVLSRLDMIERRIGALENRPASGV